MTVRWYLPVLHHDAPVEIPLENIPEFFSTFLSFI